MLSLRFQAVGERFGLDNETVLEGYELFHLSFQNKLKNIPLTFFIHATNIFNMLSMWKLNNMQQEGVILLQDSVIVFPDLETNFCLYTFLLL